MKRVGIIQPNYIPWRGYFDFIRQVDTFVFLDDVQYTKQDWRNRNKIRLKNGDLTWLTVPVRTSADTLIKDVEIDHKVPWVRKHLTAIELNYNKTPFFDMYFDPFRKVLEAGIPLLSDLDMELTKLICGWLGISNELRKSSDLQCAGTKDHKLIEMMQKVGGTHYLSGPAARAYIQPDLWKSAGIEMSYIRYPDYPEYPQIAAPFAPGVSVLDLVFMTGPKASEYIWGDPNQSEGTSQT